jgi:predicted metal-dependent hydrolase
VSAEEARLAPNHGKVFKSFMHAYLPDWERQELWLREFTGSESHRDIK